MNPNDVATPDAHSTENRLASLAPHTVVGSYELLALIGAESDRNSYLARVASDEPEEARRNDPYLRLIEGRSGALVGMQALENLQLRHPRLLALRDFFTQADRDYAVIDMPGDTWPVEPSQSLKPEEALAVGVIIGEVILFLHGRGVAHTNISLATVIIAPSGVFLSGLEDAIIIETGTPAADAAFAQDANALAQLVAALSPEGATASEPARMLTTKGAAGEYERVQDVVADCLRALPDGLPKLSDEDATAPLALSVGHATTVGMVRSINQDSLGMLTFEVIDDQPAASPGGIFLVADGMGGEAQGEVASRIAARMIVAEVARRFLSPAARATASDTTQDETPPGDAATQMHIDSISALTEAFRAANARIRNLARRLEAATGTTATALMFFGHEGVIGHVGDSRAYLVRGGEIVQLTHDHSLVQKLIDIGQYRPDEAEMAMPRNYLYRSLGQTDEMEVDTRVLKIGAGDTFMICSDGLWDLIPPEEIRDLLTGDLPPSAAARELTHRANAAGGYDNSSVLIVRFTRRAE